MVIRYIVSILIRKCLRIKLWYLKLSLNNIRYVMENIKAVKHIYPNGIEYKFKNKRIAVIECNSRFVIKSKLLGVGSPINSKIVKDKITISEMLVSEESALCLLDALSDMLGFKLIKK
jgi:hypothetical protein